MPTTVGASQGLRSYAHFRCRPIALTATCVRQCVRQGMLKPFGSDLQIDLPAALNIKLDEVKVCNYEADAVTNLCASLSDSAPVHDACLKGCVHIVL